MREAASRIRLLVLDVDGVLTDNAVYVGQVDGRRVELKQFSIQDGLGFSLLRGSGIDVAWLSGRLSDATAVRAAELRIEDVIQTPDGHKLPAMQEMLTRRGLSWEQVAFVGDDLADVPVMERVGLPIAVANAVPEVKRIAAHVTMASGGRGAVREAIETLLRARDGWEDAIARYLTPRQALA